MGKKVVEQEIRKDFFETVMAQHDLALAMKPLSFMKGMIAEGIKKPTEKSEIKNILKKSNCVIRGGASTPTASVLPHEGETILSTTNMQGISIKKKYADIQAGTPFYKIIHAAKQEHLEVPSYPVTYHTATIGGYIANNGLIGLNSRGTGYLQEYIEELEVVTTAGITYKVRGKDILDFFGSEGTLGVITKVRMKLLEKETRYIHMYGFEGAEDMMRFFEQNDDIYIAYFMNHIAAKQFSEEWQQKFIPEYTLLVIDKNWRDDYKETEQGISTELARKGVSYIYPKDVVKYCFRHIGTFELSIGSKKNNMHIADGIVKYENLMKTLTLAHKNKLPLFANLGKKEALYRIYANAGNIIKKQKFMSLMDKFYAHSEPNCSGSFFRKYLENTKRFKRLAEAKDKYQLKDTIVPRLQLYPNSSQRLLFRGILNLLGGNLW